MAKEKMMRYALVIAAIILAACTVPPMEQRQDTKPVPISPAIEITAPRESQKEPVKEVKPAAPAPKPKNQPSPCAGIEAGDLKDTINAKLDCLKEHG